MNMAEHNVILSVEDLHKSFPNGSERLHVLSGIHMHVHAGEVVSITGESGSGKSTLLGLVAGLDTPDSGTIRVGDRAVDRMTEDDLTVYRRHTVGLIFQFHYLLRDFTALENVMLPALMQGTPGGMPAGTHREEVRHRAMALLKHVGLEERAGHLPPQLSGGERQRVATARALINDPAVILADEPTGNLDDRNSRMVEDTLLNLAAELQRTLVVVTHNRDLAHRAGRVLVLEQGCLVSP